MLDELQTAFKATLYDRIKSPFWGALIISWAVWNWDFLFVLLFPEDGISGIARIERANAVYVVAWCTKYLGPLGSALLLTLVAPKIQVLLSVPTIEAETAHNKAKFDADRSRFLTTEQGVEILNQRHELGEKLKEALEERDRIVKEAEEKVAGVANLKDELSAANTSLRDLKQLNASQTTEIESLKGNIEELKHQVEYLKFQNESNKLDENISEESSIEAVLIKTKNMIHSKKPIGEIVRFIERALSSFNKQSQESILRRIAGLPGLNPEEMKSLIQDVLVLQRLNSSRRSAENS